MTPVKLRLIKKESENSVIVVQETIPDGKFYGRIGVVCDGPQAFAEIVTRLLESDLAVAAVQDAIHCLQMAKSPSARVADMRRLQDIHFKLTGWHYDSAATPAPIEGVPVSAGAISMEQAKSIFGTLDPDKVGKMFHGMPSSKIKVVPALEENVPDFHPASLKE